MNGRNETTGGAGSREALSTRWAVPGLGHLRDSRQAARRTRVAEDTKQLTLRSADWPGLPQWDQLHHKDFE